MMTTAHGGKSGNLIFTVIQQGLIKGFLKQSAKKKKGFLVKLDLAKLIYLNGMNRPKVE